MEENNVKSTCGGTRLEFKIEKDEKNFDLKSDLLLNFLFKIWQDEKNLFPNLTRCIFFNPKTEALQNFYIKIWRVVYFFNLKSDTL